MNRRHFIALLLAGLGAIVNTRRRDWKHDEGRLTTWPQDPDPMLPAELAYERQAMELAARAAERRRS